MYSINGATVAAMIAVTVAAFIQHTASVGCVAASVSATVVRSFPQ